MSKGNSIHGVSSLSGEKVSPFSESDASYYFIAGCTRKVLIFRLKRVIQQKTACHGISISILIVSYLNTKFFDIFFFINNIYIVNIYRYCTANIFNN